MKKTWMKSLLRTSLKGGSVLAVAMLASLASATSYTEAYTFTGGTTSPVLAPEGGWTYGTVTVSASGDSILKDMGAVKTDGTIIAPGTNVGNGNTWEMTFNAPTGGVANITSVNFDVVMYDNSGNAQGTDTTRNVTFTLYKDGDTTTEIGKVENIAMTGKGNLTTATNGAVVINFATPVTINTSLTIKAERGTTTTGCFFGLKTLGITATVPEAVWKWDGTGGTATGTRLDSGEKVYAANGVLIKTADEGITVKANAFSYSFWTQYKYHANWKSHFGFANSNGFLGFEDTGSDATLEAYGTSVSPNPRVPLSDSEYRYVTIVSDGGTGKVYVNGVDQNQDFTCSSWTDFASDTAEMIYFGLGCEPTTGGGTTRGCADGINFANVRIYNSALTAAEVRLAYLESLVPKVATYTAEISEDVNFSEIDFGDTVTENDSLVLTVTKDVTITMDAALVVAKMTLNGTGKVTFVGDEKITVDAVEVNADTDVAAVTARFEIVSVAAEKTLTVDLNTRWSTKSGEGTIAETDRSAMSFYVNSGYGNATYSTGTTYGWMTAQTDGANWQALADSVSDPKDKNGITVSGATITVTAKGGAWRHSAPAQLGSVTRDYYDGQWNLSLSGIPYTEYAVVLYMATDNTGKSWGSVKVTSGSTETYYTYDSNRELQTGDASSTWGVTATANGGEGVDVMVIPGLTGDISLLTHGTSGGNALRGGLFAMQIINMGAESEKKTFTATLTADADFSDLTWAEGSLEEGLANEATVTISDGKTLTIDALPTLAKVNLLTATASDEVYVNIPATTPEEVRSIMSKLDMSGATGLIKFSLGTYTGTAAWMAYEFDEVGAGYKNTGSEGTGLTWDGGGSYGGSYSENAFTNLETDAEGNPTNRALNLPAQPYRSVSSYPPFCTAVMYAKAGSIANGVLVSFGSVNNGTTITLATGANPAQGDMRLVQYADGGTPIDLVENLKVANAQSAYHLYAFAMYSMDGKTHIEVYVDGVKLTSYTSTSVIQLNTGLQIASIHGGLRTSGLEKLGGTSDTATMDFFRVYDCILSEEMLAQMAVDNPYVSSSGTATRALDGTAANWIETSGTPWSQVTQNAAGGTETNLQNAPNNGTNIVLDASAATQLTINLPADTPAYETLTINGDVTLVAGAGTETLSIAGRTTINGNVTMPYDLVSLATVTVKSGKTLTIDASQIDLSQVWSTTTIGLTGMVELEDDTAQVEVIEPTAGVTGRTLEVLKTESGYALQITFTGSLVATVPAAGSTWADLVWKLGSETVATPTSFTNLPVTLIAEEGATLTLGDAVTVKTATLQGATLTLTGNTLTTTKVTLDGGSLATMPTNISTPLVEGTAGTETITLTVDTDVSWAMQVKNCALTKAGTGKLELKPNGVDLDTVTVTLAAGNLQLSIDGDGADPFITNSTFIYVDADADGVADGELINYGWVHADTGTTTFVVPDGVVGKAFVASNFVGAGAIEKQGNGEMQIPAKSSTYERNTVITAGTLNYVVDGYPTLSGVISGAGKVKVASGTITITGANTYTGGTELGEGVVTTINNKDALGTGTVTGVATVKMVTGADGAYNGLNLLKFSDANTTLAIDADNTVTGYFTSNSGAIAAKVVLNGTVSLTDGSSSGRYTFTGPWTGTGVLSLSGGPTDAIRFAGDMSGFTGNLSVAGGRAITFCGTDTATTQKYSGKIFIHSDHTYVATVNGTWTAPVVVGGGATLAGSGVIAGSLTFEDGAILDVTGGALAVDTLATLPATLTVKANAKPSSETGNLDLIKVKTPPADLTTVAITVQVAGVSMGSDYTLVAGTADAEGYQMLQLEAPATATEYVVDATQYTTLSAALNGGVFGTTPTSPMSMVIDFGDVATGGTAVPGTFEFDTAVEFVKVTVRGTNGGTVTKADDATMVVTIADIGISAGVSCTMDPALVADAASVALAGDSVLTLPHGDAAECVIGAMISGNGKLVLQAEDVSAGAIKLAVQNSYAGGTIIAENTTVVLGNAGALGTSSIMGSGTIISEGFWPTNRSGLTLGNAATETTPASGWTGTVILNGNITLNSTAQSIETLGNANSKLIINGTLTGYLANVANCLVPVELNGSLTLNDGYNNQTFSIKKLTGTGVLTHNKNSNYAINIVDASAFTGELKIQQASAKIFIGDYNAAKTEAGKIVVAAPAVIADGKTWSATNGIQVIANGVLSGTGTLGSATTLLEGATLVASPTACLKLAAGQTLTLPATLNVQLPEGTTFTEGTPVVILDRADTTTLDVTGKAATVKVGDAVNDDVILITTTTGDLAVSLPSTFTYTATANAENLWTDLTKWSSAALPTQFDKVVIKADAAGAVITCDTLLALRQLSVEGEAVTILFSRDVVTQAMYEAIPTTVTLLTATEGLDEKVTVQLATLKYSAMATVTQDATTATAALTLPESAKTGRVFSDIIAISFGASDKQIADGEVVGFGDYATLGRNWTKVTDDSSTFSQNLVMVPYDGRTSDSIALTSLSNAMTVNAGTGAVYWSAVNSSISLLKGYIDDGGNRSFTISLPETKAAGSYTVVLYSSADTGNAQFAHFTVNGTNYTAVDGKTQVGNSNWGSTGPNNSSADTLAEGTNFLLIEDQTDATLTIVENGAGGYGRGNIAGIQVIFGKDVYDLIPGVTATVSAATADTVVAWADLTWIDDDGNPAAAPVANTPATLVFESDATVDLTGATALQIQALGYNHRVRFVPESIPEGVPFVFSEDTIYRFATANDTLPSVVERLPGTLRYEYTYDATTVAYSTIEKTTSDFAAGFAGRFVANGGTLRFTAGEVSLSGVSGTSQKTTIEFAGTSQTTASDILRFGESEVMVCDTAIITTPRLSLSDGAPGYTTALTLEDDAQIRVTGTTNEDANSASIMFGHWNGPSSFTLRDNAKFIAESTDVLVGLTRNNQTITLDGGEMRVRGIKLSANASGTNTLNLDGGRLLVGETGINHYGSATLILNCNGGALGALKDTVTFGADTAATIATLTGVPIFDSATEATLVLAQTEPFMTSGTVTTRNGTLQIGDATLTEITVDGGALKVNGAISADTVTIASQAKIAFDGGILTAGECTLNDLVTFEIPLRTRLSDGGYLQMRDGAALPDLSGLVLSLVLDANRADADKVLPEVPLVLGTYVDGAEPNVKGFGLMNNTNNAIADSELVLQQGDLGAGLYAVLSGSEVLTRHNVEFGATGYLLDQKVLDAYPYFYLIATEADAPLSVPAEGVAVSHPTFTGEDMRIVVTGDTMVTPLKTNCVSIATDLTFDLSAWVNVLPDFVRGAVRDVPASFCLISGGVTMAEGISLSVDMGSFTLPNGFDATVEATKDGLYLVVTANRPAHTVSVNFTNAATPLSTPPAKPGVYPVDVVAWNDLNSVYSSTALKVTDFGGVASSMATSLDGTETTRLLVYTSKVNTVADAPSSMLKVWLSDTEEQTIRVQNVPFEAYRVALVFANDLEAAAYAPIRVGESVYTMDGEGYTRRDITPYVILNPSTGLVAFEVAGDEAWGSTDFPEAAVPVLAGTNALVTDVLTSDEVEIMLPAAVYGRLYAGLAALQIVEAPSIEAAPAAATFSYAFTTAGEYNLADLTLTKDGAEALWVSATTHSLALSSDVDVTITLPIDFVADAITLSGSGKLTLKMENDGGALLNTLDASALTGDVTVDFACMDVAFVAPTGVTTFNKAFNNNGQPYMIAAGATLVLGEHFTSTTNMEPALFADVVADLRIDSASQGTLRRNYPVSQNRPGQHGYAWDITLAYRDVTFANADYWQPDLLIEEGDNLVVNGNNLWVTGNTTRRTFTYRQTGGTVTMGDTTANNNGFLFAPAGNNAQVDGDIAISGGRLHTSAILAWDASAQVSVNVTESGVLSLWNKFHAKDNAALTATFANGGTLELAGTSLAKGGNGAISVTIEDGVITTAQTEATMTLPVTFSGTDVAPTKLAPEEGCTLVLNAENTGSGVVEVTQGKVAIANAVALASTTTTVKTGATFEARGFAADAVMNNKVVFEEGATLSATAADGVTTVRIAGTLEMPTDQTTIQYRLNGELYDGVTVDVAAGTVTFTTKVTVTDVTWDAAQASGTWGDGLAGAWVDSATYYNGAAVTFVNATPSKVDVTVQGDVRPASLTWGASSADTYRFVGSSALSFLTLTGTALDMGSGQVYDIPVATASDVVLTGNYNTYRLIGELSNGRKTASMIASGTQWTNNAEGALKCATWCTDGATLAPKSGETQIVSAMGYSAESATRSHLSGSGNVTITGGGTVQFGGAMLESSNADLAFQNKAFTGKILVTDGSTLDVTMTRARHDNRPWDDHPFFALPATAQNVAGEPLWTSDTAGISVQNGATFRVSGCRSFFGGWANRNNATLLQSFPVEIGTEATAEFSFAEREQVFPHGFRFFGDGAKLLATQNMFVTGGITLQVAGIGDTGDRADSATDTAVDANGDPVNADTYGKLTAGITAEIASGATTGLVPWGQPDSAANPLELAIGEGSTLNLSANLLAFSSNTASRGRFSFKKTGTGAVRFLQTVVDVETTLDLSEGILGGTATFTHGSTTVTAAAGTVVEAGLSIPVLSVAKDVTFAINPTGSTVLHAGRLAFTNGGHYTITSLIPEAEIAEAEGLPAMKVISWNTVRAADSAVFTLDDVLTAKGYGLELRTDGLYLMKQITYVRELAITEAGAQNVLWYSSKAWYRLDDPTQTLRDYDPAEGEAVTALFLLDEQFAAEGATLPVVTLRLTKEVTFANVRFAAPVEENGETILKTLPVTVYYNYNLTNETMPEADRAVRFTWVPTLVLMRDDAPGLATLTVNVPQGYEYTINNTTVMVYASAAKPALNINFTAGISGDGAWIDNTADPCGVVPFAGVYWNNASTVSGNLAQQDANHTVMTLTALPAGVEANADGQATTCEVTYAFNQGNTVASRMTGNADAALVASYLAGNSAHAISEAVRVAGNMTDAGTQNGWQVRLASVPFETYDLYLLLAGASNDSVTYPAVRIKVGNESWRTFSMVNGWAAPAASNSTWQGEGSLVKGEFVDGRNVLHLRVQAAAGSSLEIAPWDNGQANATAAASVGLAALQVIRCDDGAAMERVGAGKWSDAGGWRRTLTGGTETGAWLDATTEVPRYASIPMVQQLEADTVAATPYLALTGAGSMILKGKDAMLSTGALDLTAVERGSSLTFGADVFAEPINVILAPEVTICVPENSTGTVENRWIWINDDAARGTDSTTATIQKKLAGDVVFFNPVSANLQIDDGTLWLASNANGSAAGSVTGAGTFGKKGLGTLTHSGTFTLTGTTPLRVSEGTLALSSALTGISAGSTVLVDGGTLSMPSGGGFTTDALVRLENGTLICRGTMTNNLPAARLANGSVIRVEGVGGWQGYTFESMIVEGTGNELVVASAGAGGACVDVRNDFVVMPGATLTVTRPSSGGLRVISGVVDVRDGGKLTTNSRIGRGTASGYGSATDLLTKVGAGLWRIEQVLSAKGDASWGQTLDVAEGEVCFAFGGATYDVGNETPITVKAAARLSGNVVFTDKSPIVFEEGAIVRNGVAGVSNSKLTFHTVTFNKDTVFEMDLRNTTALTISNAATFMAGEMQVRLLNMGESFTGEKQLIAWPTSQQVPCTFTSPEAMALDAVLEKRTDGLYLVASNASYVWADQDGDWSATNGWTYQENPIDYPEITDVTDEDTPVARIVALDADASLTVDKGTATADGAIWKAKSLVTSTGRGRTLSLNQGATTTTGLNSVMAWSDIWKLGEGDATFSAPVQFRNAGTGASVNVAGGTLTLTHPLTVALPVDQQKRTDLPAAVDVASGSVLVYNLSATQDELTVINSTYNPLEQTFTGDVTGEGTLRVAGANNVITLSSTADSNLNLDVQNGSLILNGDATASAARATRRTINVAQGAQLDLAAEYVLGGSTNITWTLAAAPQNGALVKTTDARIRGAVKVVATDTTAQNVATMGSTSAQLDAAMSVDVAAATTLQLLGEWTAADDSTAVTALTKRGAGVLEMIGDFMANIPVTIVAGDVRVGVNAVKTYNDNDGATVPVWTVASGAMLTFGGGTFSLNNGSLNVQAGAVLNGATSTTAIDATATLADRAVVTFGESGNVNVGTLQFKQATTVNGVITVNLDALDPATLTKTSLTLVEFDNGMRSGSGSFQLGGNKLVAWAEHGWTLRDNGTEVILQNFGGDTGYYTWAGDDSVEATGLGNWANTFWVSSATPDALVAWPTATDVSPSVMLQDVSPIDGAEIPEAARTLDWTLPEQTIGSFYVKNSEDVDYKLTSSTGSALFEVTGDFLKAGAGKLTVERPIELGREGALRLLGGETELTGALTASSGNFTKSVTVAGANTVLRFSGTSSRSLGGLLEGDEQGTLIQSGSGSLTIADSVNKLKALSVENGHVKLTADEQYVIEPDVSLAEGATLTYSGTLSGAGTVLMAINSASAPAGTLLWGATTASASDKAPRLGTPTGSVINVKTFRYQPTNGHLILDPNAALAPGFALAMDGATEVTSALWVGAQAVAGDALTVSALTGAGVIGVEPIVELASDETWSTHRIVTVEPTITDIAAVEAFEGSFMGATTPDNTDIQIGLTVQNPQGTDMTYFRYMGTSTHALLGTLTVGDKACAEITGTWAGDVAVAAGGQVMGNGTIGADYRTVTVPKGAILSGTTYGRRIQANNTYTSEVIPATLTVKGTLSLEAGSVLNTMIRKDEKGNAWVSTVMVDNLQLPTVLEDGAEEVKLTVNVDMEDGVIASGVKILGWTSLNGGQKINGNLTVTINGQQVEGYSLRKKSDGLYLYRENARFWMILH